ncbi:MAG: hypothetical protein SGILL_007334 [Bacillariaceae sp.]
MIPKRRTLRACFAIIALVAGVTTALSTIHTTARKRLKRSYVQRVGLGRQSKDVLSSDELRELLRKYSRKKYGSGKYRKGWRHFMYSASSAIRQELSENLPHPVNRKALENLAFRLGVAADTGQRPCFVDAGARSGYALDFFCRARNLADFLMDRDQPIFPDFWGDALTNSPMLSREEDEAASSKSFQITSIAGGPGYDFLAAALVALYSASDLDHVPSIRTTVLDYEEGWKDLVHCMNAATRKVLPDFDFACDWGGKCDVTKPLSHPNNAACLPCIDSTHLWTCQYVVAENAQRLRDSDFVFFKDLFEAMPEGALFILTETTPYLWHELTSLMLEHCPYMQVGFPNKRGYQMVLRKGNEQDVFSLSEEEGQLLQHFEGIAILREGKLEKGWERQEPKNRGLVA